MRTLREIVTSALSESEQALKLASARDAAPAKDPADFLDAELSPPAETAAEGESTVTTPPAGVKAASAVDVLSDADHALKLAEALDLGANIITVKLATGTVHDAPGPAVHRSGFENAQGGAPKAHSKVTDRIAGGAKAHPADMPTDRHDFTSVRDTSGAAKNTPGKTASAAEARLLRGKVAAAEVLLNAGQTEAAEKLLAEVRAKVAQDPSSPPPSLPAHSAAMHLDTSPGPSSHIPDNAGLISIDKAKAKDPTTRETTRYFSEPPKRDPAVGAHTLTTTGQKLSALDPVVKKAAAQAPVAEKPAAEPEKKAALDPELAKTYLAKVIKTASDPDADPAERSRAQEIVKNLKSRAGDDLDALLT